MIPSCIDGHGTSSHDDGGGYPPNPPSTHLRALKPATKPRLPAVPLLWVHAPTKYEKKGKHKKEKWLSPAVSSERRCPNGISEMPGMYQPSMLSRNISVSKCKSIRSLFFFALSLRSHSLSVRLILYTWDIIVLFSFLLGIWFDLFCLDFMRFRVFSHVNLGHFVLEGFSIGLFFVGGGGFLHIKPCSAAFNIKVDYEPCNGLCFFLFEVYDVLKVIMGIWLFSCFLCIFISLYLFSVSYSRAPGFGACPATTDLISDKS